jgi:hypothetical protein
LTKKYLWVIFVLELIMTKTKPIEPIEPNTIPEPDNSVEQLSAAAVDPSQTKMLPQQNAAVSKQGIENTATIDTASSGGLAAESKPASPSIGWFKKLSQSAIIWISLSIILIFLAVFFLLIMQGQHKNKILKPIAGEQIEETGNNNSINASGALKNKLGRQAARSTLLLTDDEFAGQAPIVVKASGPVISAAIDPEVAAMVDALKIRLKISTDSQSISRGNTITKITKGEFRGFKINVEEKNENQNKFSEEVSIITPKKGYIKTVNHILDSIRDSDLERFAEELRNAGLEIIKPLLQSGGNVFQVQLKVASIFGKPTASDLLISGKSVGKISLGMPTTQLETMLLSSYIVLKRKVLVNDIYYDVYKILDQSNDPLFFIYENEGQVWGISIISEIFKTDKGIGINSSLGNMRINYPRVYMGISEKKTPFVKIDGVDGLFVIQNEGVDIMKHIFPSKTKIISILIGNSLEFE